MFVFGILPHGSSILSSEGLVIKGWLVLTHLSARFVRQLHGYQRSFVN